MPYLSALEMSHDKALYKCTDNLLYTLLIERHIILRLCIVCSTWSTDGVVNNPALHCRQHIHTTMYHHNHHLGETRFLPVLEENFWDKQHRVLLIRSSSCCPVASSVPPCSIFTKSSFEIFAFESLSTPHFIPK